MKTLWVATILCCFSFIVSSQNAALTTAEKQPRFDPSKIDIVRDNFGVPHIFAETDAEVAYGLAWAHAEDDFETIQKAFLASRSMLGQHSGREGAIVDHVVHLLRLRQLVEDRYETDISPSFTAVLKGYCDGFNAFAETHSREVLVKKFFPVTPQDLVTYSVLQLALGCGVEGALKKIYKGTAPLAEWEPTGSNAFAFNSKKTADGNVYLNINTHHPMEGQVAWYEAHLSSEEGWNILGGLFPGSPVIFTGFNENLGWTHTVNRPDRLDIYQLEMNPDNAMEYKVDDQWYTLEESTVKLKVKITPGFNLGVKRKIYWSKFGPTLITDKGVFSIRTAGIMDIRSLDQWYWMNKSRNFSEFKKALKMEALPSYNIVYGDRYDTIYYICNGKLPVREPGFNWKGTLPGNTSKVLWSEFHPVENLPQVLNPSSGYVYNANHSPFKATDEKDNIRQEHYDPTMGYETHDNNRSLRVMELMAQHEKLSYEDFKRIKYDLQLPQKLAFPVNIDTLFLFSENDHPELADVITALKSWDRKGTIDSKGAAVFGVAFYYVAAKYDEDETFRVMTKPLCLEALKYTKEYMMKNFGTTDISLGEFQRLERGGKSLPLAGLPDMLATMYSMPSGDGRLRGAIGDCYIAFAKYTAAGPEIETINCYGASNRKNSPHYNDQMELYQKQQTKKMTLNRDEVYMNARLIYHPEPMHIPVPDRLTRARR
jgi:acyl-homoserine-lactone acylase